MADSQVHEPNSVLVADDQEHIGQALKLLLRSDGFRADYVASPDAAIKAVEMLRDRRGFGDLLALGSREMARKIAATTRCSWT